MRTASHVPLAEASSSQLSHQELDRLLKPLARLEREQVRINDVIRTLELLRKTLRDKLEAIRAHDPRSGNEAPRSSPLDRVKVMVAASRDLRVQNGNLSAESIAKLYGISLNKLALWLGRSRQALNKTPDADSLQNELSYFERIARLRTALAEDAEFRKWLRMPNSELNNETPLRWIERKRWQALADLVDDMLTGATS